MTRKHDKEVMGKVNRGSALLDELDGAIRRGEKGRAKRAILELSRQKVARPLAVRLASLARRVEIPKIGIQILGRWVRPKHRAVEKPTFAEQAEYAACLIRLGAAGEAFHILDGLDAAKVPQVLLYRAFGLIGQWDYAAVIPILERFLSLSPEPYEKRVAQLNLAAALVVVGSHETAAGLLGELSAALERDGHHLLFNATLEIQTRSAIARRDWQRARLLCERVTALSVSGELHSLFAQKWQVYLSIREQGDHPETRAQLESLRLAAVKIGNYETVRECDWFQAICCRDSTLLAKVYFGTPYPAYRRALLGEWKEWGPAWTAPEEYLWQSSDGRRGKMTFDLPRRKWEGKTCFSPGEVAHRFALALTLDFYRPLRLAEVHSHLYPNEFYNPISSPNRVHQAIHRWREFARSSSIPIDVEEINSHYRFSRQRGLDIMVPLVRTLAENDPILDAVAPHFGQAKFSLGELALFLNASVSTSYRWVQKSMERGLVIKEGRGRSCRYQLVK